MTCIASNETNNNLEIMPINTINVTSADQMQMSLAAQYLNQSQSMANAMLNNSVSVTMNHLGEDYTYTGLATNTVNWDPSLAHQLQAADGTIGVQSPAMAFVHEFAHAVFGADETAATAFETQVARELGEPTRANYQSVGANVIVKNATEHTENGHWEQMSIDGTIQVGAAYNGTVAEKTAPDMGTGMGSSGGSGGGGGLDMGGGGTDIIGVGNDMDNWEDHSHWQNVPYGPSEPAPWATEQPITLVGVAEPHQHLGHQNFGHHHFA